MKYHAGVLVLIVDRVSLSFGMVCGLICGLCLLASGLARRFAAQKLLNAREVNECFSV
jgi:hypothetical protein